MESASLLSLGKLDRIGSDNFWEFPDMSGLKLISKTLPGIAGRVCSKKYIMLGRVVTYWDDIIGKDLALETQPAGLRINRKKGKKYEFTLEISASPSHATLLRYRVDLMLERINQIFGENMITAIRFIPEAANRQKYRTQKREKPLTPDEKEYLSDMLGDITDPEIQEKLKSLGMAIIQDQNS